ncbi:ATP binding protein [Aureococcus anophagefferens]|nr:ATP binding protein [Aureococcus anophagefferens]
MAELDNKKKRKRGDADVALQKLEETEEVSAEAAQAAKEKAEAAAQEAKDRKRVQALEYLQTWENRATLPWRFNKKLQQWRVRQRFAPAAQALRRASLLPSAHYLALVADGKITRDEHQLTALAALDRVYAAVEGYAPPAPAPAQPSGGLGGALGAFARRVGLADAPAAKEARGYDSKAPRGAYVHGGVGAGKTFTMDMFFDLAPTDSKQRVHFHAFMLSVHRRLHDLRGDDRIKLVADDVLREGALVCFDEFQVTDIADALIMKALFEHLFEGGAVVVATSNRRPRDLYANGIQRQLFLPFIPLLEARCEVVSVEDSVTDYRLCIGADGSAGVYFLEGDADGFLDARRRLTKEADDAVAAILKTETGREVRVPRALVQSRACCYHFDELCRANVGAADYLAIAGLRRRLPGRRALMTTGTLDVARRFITLVDALYEHGVKIVVRGAAPPTGLFVGDKGARDEAFAFDRTASRLIEMGSLAYLTKQPTRAPAVVAKD